MLGVSEDGVDGAAVLAQQAIEAREARLDLLEPLGVGLGSIDVGAKLVAEVARLESERHRAGRQGVEGRIDPRAPGQRGLRLAREPGDPPALLASGDREQRRACGIAQRLGVTQPVAVGLEGLALVAIGRGPLDLVELEPQEVDVPFASPLAQLELLPLPAQRADPGVDVAIAGEEREVLGAGEAVEDLRLGGGEGELAVFVLAVEGEEPGTERPQVGRGRRAPSDEGG